MRRLVVLIIGALLSAALVPAAVAAQSATPLTELALLELEGCHPARRGLVVSGGFVGADDCGSGSGLQLATGRNSDGEIVWEFESILGVPVGAGIGATRTTFGSVSAFSTEPFTFVSGTTGTIDESLPMPEMTSFVYDGGTFVGGRAPNGAERFIVPVGVANFEVGDVAANFVVFTRKPERPMGELPEADESSWEGDVLLGPVDGSVPTPFDYEYEVSPAALFGDTIAIAYESLQGAAAIVADIGTGEYRVVSNPAPVGPEFSTPRVMSLDEENARVFVGWGGLDLGAEFPYVTMIDLDTADSVQLTGLPVGVTALTVARRGELDSDLLVSTAGGDIYYVEVSADGVASPELLAAATAGPDDLVVTEMSASGDLLAVLERTTSFTVVPQVRVRLFEIGDLGGGSVSPFNVEVVAPGTDPDTYRIGPFTDIKDLIVGEPGLPVTECLVDVESANEMAICFVAGERVSYVDALIATERPPDEVLWIGRSSEEPVKP